MIRSVSLLDSTLEAKNMIDDQVEQLLIKIEDAVDLAISQNQLYADVEIPINFYITGMKNEDAQREIYYKLIKALEKARYKVKIYQKSRLIFRITWITSEDIEKKRFMDKYISSHF